MNYIGLILEIIILCLAIYGYLFSRGFFRSKDPETQMKADKFRKENGWWLRIGCILIMVLMSVEIALNFKTLFLS